MIQKTDQSFYRRYWRWLELSGFRDDPFGVYEADQEDQDLPNFFIDRSYLFDVIGNPARPQTTFLLAGRGDGKTATRKMVAYECTHAEFRRKTLAVHYLDFAPLIEKSQKDDLSDINIRDHLELILRCILKAIAEEIPATYFDLLPEEDPTYNYDKKTLKSFINAYSMGLAKLKLNQLITSSPRSIIWDELTPYETLEIISNIIIRLGHAPGKTFESLYILVDKVDETVAGAKAIQNL